MLFDTDILIWVQQGNHKASQLIEKAENRYISIQTYMELIQCAPTKMHINYIRDFIRTFNFMVLPLTENIGHRALIYIEEYSLSCGLRAGDAIIAATATENNLKLSTGNKKHFQVIKELNLVIFKEK